MMKRILCALLCIAVLSGVFISPAAAEKNPIPKASQAVVAIAAGIGYKEGKVYALNGESYGTGTGFGVSPVGKDAQYFVTNCHVVSEEVNGIYDPYEFAYIMVDGADIYDESTMIYAEVIYTGANEGLDVAILKTKEPVPGVATLPLISAEDYPLGETIYVLGFPSIAEVKADTQSYTTKEVTVTEGITSRHLTTNGVKALAHTALANSGNSGGPLIDEKGQVLGMHTWSVSNSEQADRRLYAIYADYIMEALDYRNIPYQKGWTNAPSPALIAGIAAVIVVLLALVLLVVKLGKKRKPAVRVQAIQGSLTGKSWQLKDKLTIGRDPASDIVVPEGTNGVSRRHCILLRQGKDVTVTDQNSTNGTFLNGQRLAPNQPTRLLSGSVISLAEGMVRFTITFE